LFLHDQIYFLETSKALWTFDFLCTYPLTR